MKTFLLFNMTGNSISPKAAVLADSIENLAKDCDGDIERKPFSREDSFPAGTSILHLRKGFKPKKGFEVLREMHIAEENKLTGEKILYVVEIALLYSD